MAFLHLQRGEPLFLDGKSADAAIALGKEAGLTALETPVRAQLENTSRRSENRLNHTYAAKDEEDHGGSNRAR